MPAKAPEGYRYCKDCGEHLPIENFGEYLSAYCHPHWLIWNREKARRWRKKNPGRSSARAKRWRGRNPKKVKAQNALLSAEQKKLGYPAHKKWVEENREHLRAYEREYRRLWRKQNPEKEAARRHRRRARKHRAPGQHTGEELKHLRAEFDGLCVYCGNVSDTFDHITPLFFGGSNFIWNLVPACRSCNSQKQHKDPLTFLKGGSVSAECEKYIHTAVLRGRALVDPKRYVRKPYQKISDQSLWDELEEAFRQRGKVSLKDLQAARFHDTTFRRRLGNLQQINDTLGTKWNVEP